MYSIEATESGGLSSVIKHLNQPWCTWESSPEFLEMALNILLLQDLISLMGIDITKANSKYIHLKSILHVIFRYNKQKLD